MLPIRRLISDAPSLVPSFAVGVDGSLAQSLTLSLWAGLTSVPCAPSNPQVMLGRLL